MYTCTLHRTDPSTTSSPRGGGRRTVSRNFTLPTIKMLFFEAADCAYPGCGSPLVVAERGRTTVVSQIAHIRSGQEGGPRYDSTYPRGCIDEAANLLLLCPTHHAVVDRQDDQYSIEE